MCGSFTMSQIELFAKKTGIDFSQFQGNQRFCALRVSGLHCTVLQSTMHLQQKAQFLKPW